MARAKKNRQGAFWEDRYHATAVESNRYLKDAHDKWVDNAIPTDNRGKENKWTQNIVVGSEAFIENMNKALR